MTNNILYLYQDECLFYENLDNFSDKLLKINYIQYLCKYTYEKLYQYINEQIDINHIDTLFVYFTNCDSSLDIQELYRIKRDYNLKFVFIFNDSHNSFEYIDRYYAQLADLVIIPNIPIVYDFYKTLGMSVYKIGKYLNNTTLIENNIFSSSLINLISNDIKISHLNTDFNNDILEILNVLLNKEIVLDTKLLLDNKFLYTQDLFKIYWILKTYFRTNKSVYLFKLLKYYKYSFHIFKLFNYLKYNKNNLAVIKIFNQLFYKEYSI